MKLFANNQVRNTRHDEIYFVNNNLLNVSIYVCLFAATEGIS